MIKWGSFERDERELDIITTKSKKLKNEQRIKQKEETEKTRREGNAK